MNLTNRTKVLILKLRHGTAGCSYGELSGQKLLKLATGCCDGRQRKLRRPDDGFQTGCLKITRVSNRAEKATQRDAEESGRLLSRSFSTQNKNLRGELCILNI
jgi:ribonuclease PH